MAAARSQPVAGAAVQSRVLGEADRGWEREAVSQVPFPFVSQNQPFPALW